MQAQTAEALVQERTSELSDVFDLDSLRIGENLELFEDSESGHLFIAEEALRGLPEDAVVVELEAEDEGVELEKRQVQQVREEFEEDSERRLQPVQSGASDRTLD